MITLWSDWKCCFKEIKWAWKAYWKTDTKFCFKMTWACIIDLIFNGGVREK